MAWVWQRTNSKDEQIHRDDGALPVVPLSTYPSLYI